MLLWYASEDNPEMLRLTAGCANELFRTEIADGQVHRCTGERGRERVVLLDV
jgi:hypothetical protein